MHRRKVIIGLGLSPLIAPSLVRSVHAGQDADNKKEIAAQLLFVQNAHGMSLADGKLKLEGVGASTVFFSDRPQRIAGHVPTKVFIGHWGDGGDDSFAADPPNATVSLLEGDSPQEIVVELMNPRWDGHDLTYDVKVLDGSNTAEGGACSLFIDDTVIVTNPVVVAPRPVVVAPAYGALSYRGQARRVARRTSRRTARRWR